MSTPLYTHYIYVDGIRGFFRCTVHDSDQHLKTLRERGYLRQASSSMSEWFPPHRINHVVIEGPAPESTIADEHSFYARID